MNTRLEEQSAPHIESLDVAQVPGLDDVQSAVIAIILQKLPDGIVLRTNMLHQHADPSKQITITSLEQVRALEGQVQQLVVAQLRRLARESLSSQ